VQRHVALVDDLGVGLGGVAEASSPRGLEARSARGRVDLADDLAFFTMLLKSAVSEVTPGDWVPTGTWISALRVRWR